MPGCALPERVFFRICCHVCWSVRTSWSVSPSIFRCSGGFGGPFSIVWSVVSLRMAWLRNSEAIVHS
jgi:hypothetical protein